MSGTKILWGQILVVALLALAGVWLATEWTAWSLGFQPQLGPPWFRIGGWPIYPPPAFFVWWFVYEAYAPDVFVRGAFMAAGGALVAVVVAIGMLRPVGQLGGGEGGWPAGRRWRRARAIEGALPSPRRPRACPVLCADAVGQGRGVGRPDSSDLAGLCGRS